MGRSGMRWRWMTAMVLGCISIGMAGCKSPKETEKIQQESQTPETDCKEDDRKEGDDGNAGEPERDLTQEETSGTQPSFGSEYIFPQSHARLLTGEELKSISPDQLRVARNEIYARHGRQFTSPDLQTYFEARDWYEGKIAPEEFSESLLNDIEKENVRLIKAREDMGDILDQAGVYRAIMKNRQLQLFGWNGLLEYGHIEVAMSGNYKEWYPELVDMGDYYEAKDQALSVPIYYKWDDIDRLKPGDTLTLSFGLNPDRAAYTVTAILQEHGTAAKVISVLAPGQQEEIPLVFTDVFDNGKYALAVVDWLNGDDYVIWNSDDISCACEMLYQGSFYLSKDCVIDVAGEERSVKDQWEADWERNPFGGAIFGDILEVDENGLITRIRQQVAG